MLLRRGREISRRTPRKVRIGYVFNHSFFLGGGEISLYNLICNLDHSRFEPAVVVPGSGEIEEHCRLNGIQTFVLEFPSLRKPWPGSPMAAVSRFIRLLKTRRVDIVHANGSRACFYSCLAGLTCRIPVIWHVRETIQDFALYDGLLSLLASRIICVSVAVRERRFGRFDKLVGDKIEVIHNGVDPAKFLADKSARKEIRTQLGIADDVLFGIVGSLVPLKGQDAFLKAFAEARKRSERLNAKVLCIGRSLDREYKDRLQRFIENSGLRGQIIFANHCNEIVKIYAALDVLVLPSRREGFNRALLEAMSAGLPVLASNLPEIREAVMPDKTGYLVDMDNIKETSLRIDELAANSELRRTMGRLGRKRVEEKFDIKRHVADIEAVYLDFDRFEYRGKRRTRKNASDYLLEGY